MSNETPIQWTNLSSNALKAKRISDGKLGWFCVPGPLEGGKKDPTCAHCYASKQNQVCGNNPGRHGTGHRFHLSQSKYLEPWLNQEELNKIARKRVPKKIFVCDMTDVAASIYECVAGHAMENEEEAAGGAQYISCPKCRREGRQALARLKWWPSEMIQKCFCAWATAARNGMTIQMLSKRPLRLGAELQRWALALRPGFGIPGTAGMSDEQVTAWALPERWHIGTSLGNRKGLHRIDQLRAIPAYLRFLSLEPLIEDLGEIDLAGISWVILGGESGDGARPCRLEWIDSLIEQCRGAGVAVFCKQHGSNPMEAGFLDSGPDGLAYEDRKGGDPREWDGGLKRFPREEAPA